MSRKDLRILALLAAIALAVAVVVELARHPLSGAPARPEKEEEPVAALPSPATAASEATSALEDGPRFGGISFGTGVRGDGTLNPGTIFAGDTPVVYAVWEYHNLAGGTPYRLAWYRDAGLYLDEPGAWDIARHGADGAAYVAYLAGQEGGLLPPGSYRLELYLGERLAQVATFEVLALTPTAGPTPPQSGPTTGPDRQAAGYEAARSLVFVGTPGDDDQSYTGSGTIVDGPRGLILTNWHVVGDLDSGQTYNELGYSVVLVDGDPRQPDGQVYIASVLDEYSDLALDLALLQIIYVQNGDTPEEVEYPLDLPSIALADSDKILLGDRVVVLGYPDYADDNLSWTEGVVSSRVDDWIVSDAEASHGHSGGMMLNEQGALIAIPTEVRGAEVGILLTWARPANLAQPLIREAQAALPLP